MSITLAPGEARNLGTVYLAPITGEPASIYGRVVDSDTGSGISGVLVQVGGYSGYTNSSGDYDITGIPAGNYTVTFSKAGYETMAI